MLSIIITCKGKGHSVTRICRQSWEAEVQLQSFRNHELQTYR